MIKGRCLNYIVAFALLFGLCSFQKPNEDKPLSNVIDESLYFAVQQSMLMANTLKDKPDKLPKTTNPDGTLQTCNSSWWVSGFFPGTLWYLYEYSDNEQVKEMARLYSKRVENEKFTTNNHDIGFIIFCSFGNGYRLTKDSTYLEVVATAAKSLSTRYNPLIGCIRSWDTAPWNQQWQYPVIIDNMMNLELLTWSSKKFEVEKYMDIANSHAQKTMVNHYRPDFSCFHVVSYDTITGNVEKKNTAQGYSDGSSWARGQSWGVYGYTMMYRETGNKAYLEQAQNIANFLINHPRLPEDKVPYWDYDAPDIPNAPRDASAAAIMCSALIELSQYVGQQEADNYLTVAEKQIRTLSSPQYQNLLGKGGNFILSHSVGHMPNKTEIDVPLTYADYYYVEALMRMRKLLASGKKN